MSGAAAYWYPFAGAALQHLDFGEYLQDWIEEPTPVRQDAEGGDMVLYPSFQATRYRHTVVLERFGEAGTDAVERKLQAFLTHVRKGLPFGFSRDHAKTWASITVGLHAGATELAHVGNGFSQWSGSGVVANGDELVVESADPEWYHEVPVVDALNSGTVDLTGPLVYEYSSYVLLRWRGFHPVCVAPMAAWSSQQPLTSTDNHVGRTLRLTYDFLPRATLALWAARTLEGAYENQAGALAGALSMPSVGALPLRDTTDEPEPDLHSLQGLANLGGLKDLRHSFIHADPRTWR